jgi:hypothetical protein
MNRIVPLAMAAALVAPVSANAATDADLEQKLDALAASVEALKAEVKALKAQNDALAAQQEAQPAPTAAAAAPAAAATSAVAHAGSTAVDATPPGRATLFGYGEINYNRYDHDDAATQADTRRAVFGIGYRFDDKTHFVSEFEVEHAIVSADDDGEFEVEQFYIDHALTNALNLKAGLFLVPSGLINLSHEPTRYYGVERNFVETAIIPTTWREGGLGLYGTSFGSLSWDVGVVTGFNISGWDFSAEGEGRESPLGSIHQELQNARASDLAQYVALNWNGVPGLNVGASVFTGEADQEQAGISADARTTLWETHARWRPGPWDFSALYAQGNISKTQDLNVANLGSATPIPKRFYGWYVQGAVEAWKHGTLALSPFVRYEEINTADKFASLPAGFEAVEGETEKVTTFGANFNLNRNLVFKIDYQDFDVNDDLNRFDLGLGLMF